MVQASFDTNAGQQMLTGSDASALVATFRPYDEVDVLGVNCAFGPDQLVESVRYISETWPRFTSALPNAGLPMMVDGKAHFPMGPADFTRGMMRFVEEFGVNIVGGCCGTMPEHLRLLCVKAKNHFRAAFGDLFDPIVEVDTPGPAAADLHALPFRYLPPGLL